MSDPEPELEFLAIIHSVKQSTLASNWTEQLCLNRLPDGQLMLDIRGYEALGEASDYWNEETEEYDLPDKIGGHDVLGIEDDWVLVANLVPSGNYSGDYVFRNFDWEAFRQVFASEGPEWCTPEVREKIEAELRNVAVKRQQQTSG